jgi:phosphoribosylformylglycinamidine cyclo-ligase
VYTDYESALAIISIAKSNGIDAQVIGRCEAISGQRVTVSGEHGVFEYSH